MPTDVTAINDDPNMFMDDRLNLQALKIKRVLDSSLDLESFQKLEKKELLAMLLKSAVLLHEGAEKITEQRSTITRFQMKEIEKLNL